MKRATTTSSVTPLSRPAWQQLGALATVLAMLVWLAPSSVRADERVAPDPPTDLAADVDGGEVTLSWAAPDDTGSATIAGYRPSLMVDGERQFDFDRVAATRLVMTFPNGTWTVAVTAVNADRASSVPSEPVTFEVTDNDEHGQQPDPEPDPEPEPEPEPEPDRDVPPLPFDDVADGSTHAVAIAVVADAGVISGYTDGRFGPDDEISRAQVASMLHRAVNRPAGPQVGFPDVPSGSTHAQAIRVLAGSGVISGYADGTFGPGEPISRGQFASLADRLFDVPDGETDSFPDVGSDSTHADAIGRLTAAGVISGYADGTFGPGRPISRAQAASMLYRALEDTSLSRVLNTGDLHGWGSNYGGELGDGTSGNFQTYPQPIISGSLVGRQIVDVDGRYHTVTLADDGTVHTWGSNYSGEVGNGTTNSPVTSPQQVSGGSLAGETVIQIAAGRLHTVALTADGTVHTWGNNQSGQIGNGTTNSPVTSPQQVPGSSFGGASVVRIAAGDYHTVAITADGTVHTWGRNDAGQIGNGTAGSSAVTSPQPVTGGGLAGENVTRIAAGGRHTLAVTFDDTLYAWGSSSNGQIGNGTFISAVTTPQQVSGGSLSGETVIQIAAGYNHTVALTDDNTVHTWGDNQAGQIGNGSTGPLNSGVTLPQQVSGGSLAGETVIDIAAGQMHTVALAYGGTVHAWGHNYSAQIGTGTGPGHVTSPQQVSGGSLSGATVIRIAAGDYHTLAVTYPP